MYGGYNKVFWGTIITSFNINIGPINLLPNFVGFLIVASGLNDLFVESSWKDFVDIRSKAILLGGLSFLGGLIEFFYQGRQAYSLVNIVWIIGFIIIEFLFFFKLQELSIIYLQENAYTDLKDKYIDKLRNYTIFSLLGILLLGLGMILNLEGYNAIFAILLLVVKIYLLSIFHGIKSLFNKGVILEED